MISFSQGTCRDLGAALLAINFCDEVDDVLVDQKLKTAGSLYSFMISEFHQARAFVLELMVVIILVIELIFLFRGKS
jgi:hypothetical protein